MMRSNYNFWDHVCAEDRELWEWLEQTVPGYSRTPSIKEYARSEQEWQEYVEAIKAFALRCKDADEYDWNVGREVGALYHPLMFKRFDNIRFINKDGKVYYEDED